MCSCPSSAPARARSRRRPAIYFFPHLPFVLIGGIGKEGAIEAADHASELELTEPVSLELDVGRLYHIQVITVPERHFDDPPLADQRALGAAPHVASRSLGIRTRL